MPEKPLLRKKYTLEWGALTALSKQTGRSVGHISRVIRGERQSKRLAQQIEEYVGMPLSEIELPPRAA